MHRERDKYLKQLDQNDINTRYDQYYTFCSYQQFRYWAWNSILTKHQNTPGKNLIMKYKDLDPKQLASSPLSVKPLLPDIFDS